MTTPTSRRAVLAVAAGTAALAGCGSSDDKKSSGTSGTPGPGETSPPVAFAPNTPTKSAAPTKSSAPAPGDVLAKTSDIPVGGGKVFAAKKVVVTQPEKGTFKAFSAICTHQGCTVKDVADGTINCPCHGSKYRVADASVAAGPAPRPLPAERITVENGSIHLA
ncbi:Rieske (2Fe-2S) protein [Streptomyces sp. TLI_146]|uniref:Rieske (2Fe-2S) protein n=1 Tax=Streptomyces sp. TLI_146 TaxID=1938858 RepID=UPI000C70BB67|nr:Rieske (2Fe-2S) protein [Streptomyces sp. TLI_146]PKV84930.1 nitrite reductase/ring-hydroxylating ferredoxin subunit [Streptomyces sp. TLI_146]